MIVVWRKGAWVAQRWWEQEEISLAGERKHAVAATEGEEDRGGEDLAR